MMWIRLAASIFLLRSRSASAGSAALISLIGLETEETEAAGGILLGRDGPAHVVGGEPMDRAPTYLVSIGDQDDEEEEEGEEGVGTVKRRPRGGRGASYCGATLISERVILSAGHCFACPPYNKSDPEEVEFFDNCTTGEFFVYPGDTVILNRTDVNDYEGNIVYEICEEEGGAGCDDLENQAYVILHPNFTEPYVAPDQYGNGNYSWDIWEWDCALVVLPEAKPAPASLFPVKLNSDPALPMDGEELTVMGWGNINPFLDEREVPDVPHMVEVDYVSSERCMAGDPYNYTEGTITESMMCAAAPGRDACNGDSGGPLIMETMEGPVEVGIVGFGFVDAVYRCSSPIFPGGYVRVSAVYCWIKETACHETGHVGDLCAKNDPACDSGGKPHSSKSHKSVKSVKPEAPRRPMPNRSGKSGKKGNRGAEDRIGGKDPGTKKLWSVADEEGAGHGSNVMSLPPEEKPQENSFFDF